jgi:hypothetical protein
MTSLLSMLGVVFILSVEVLLSRIPGHLDESSLWRLGARPDYGGGWTSAKLDDGLGGA